MKKKITSGIMLALLSIGVLTLAFSIQTVKAEPTTWTVDDDGPANFSSIQEAIDAANPGDTINVKTGTYYEHVFVDKAIHIIGEANDLTRVDSSNTGFSSTFEIQADGVQIKGFTLRCVNTWGRGVSIEPFYSYSTVEENIITPDTRFGIWTVFTNNDVFRNNIIYAFERGITLNFSKRCILENNIIQNSDSGIVIGMVGSESNVVLGNNLKSNKYGIAFLDFPQPNQQANTIYHNNFIGNTIQVYFSKPYSNIWDDGYPSGGNYWSDHVTVDDCYGVNQDEPGSDGIVDEPYVIDDYNRDNYPLVKPWRPVVSATVDVDPDTLHLMGKGKWITCYIELPKGYNVSDIDISTVMLDDTIPVSLLDVPTLEPVPTEIGDYDDDGIPDLMVKFDRTLVSEFILSKRISHGNVTLTITGEVDGTPFRGQDTIGLLFGAGGSKRRNVRAHLLTNVNILHELV